jgi:hypothetical protein
MTDWIQRIDGWRAITSIKSFPPASAEAVEKARKQIEEFPGDLESFLKSTNGLAAGSFKMLPLEDSRDIKRTWDSLQRANDPRSTRFLGRSPQLLERFIVFADIGVGRAAALDRTDGSIWYEEEGELRQTDLTLEGFIDSLVREIASL